MGQIEGQVAIVTGAANELARAIAQRLAREGATIVLVDADAASAEAAADAIVAKGGRAEAWGGGMGDEQWLVSIADAVAKAHGRIDILINAGHPALAWTRLADKPASDFTSAYERVILPAVIAMRAVRPHMAKQGGGRIVNLGSVYGPTANEGVVDAATMDGALAALTRAAGVEWACDGILVNFLQPAVPDIAMFKDYRADRGAIVDHLIANMPMPRLADPVEDIGGAVMFLVSDEACFIVGHKVFADGGQHLVAAAFEPGASR